MGWGEGLVNYGKGVASFAKNKGGIYFGVGFFCLKQDCRRYIFLLLFLHVKASGVRFVFGGNLFPWFSFFLTVERLRTYKGAKYITTQVPKEL